MECQLCLEHISQVKKAICPSCVRTILYKPRLDRLQSIINKEALTNRIQLILDTVSHDNSSPLSSASQIVDITESGRKFEVARQAELIKRIDLHIRDVHEQQKLVQKRVIEIRQSNARISADNAERQQKLDQARKEFEQGREGKLEEIMSDCARLENRLIKIRRYSTESRKRACEETAHLLGLCKRKVYSSDGSTTVDQYTIGKVTIPDLRDMNRIQANTLNACLRQSIHLFIAACHYLGVRPPAEIIAPHAGFPTPVILSLQSSYRASQRTGKPRPLYIEKPLPLLYKEDQSAYNLFVDGLVLFAFNIAWLCRSQGLDGLNTWESLCMMGRNLHDLLIVSTTTVTENATSNSLNKAPSFGQFSHVNSNQDVASDIGVVTMSKWDLPSLVQASDKLKAHLLAESMNAEWEMLNLKDFDEQRDDEKAILVGGPNWAMQDQSKSSRV